MPETAHTKAVAAISKLGPLRVWSLLVTVFGDLAPDQPINGPTISAIMTRIGVKPEATRVALHRLRSDGWVLSEKHGRTSLHRLTAQGQRDSLAARPRIYGTPAQTGADVGLFLMKDGNAALDPAVFAEIAPRVYIHAADTPLPQTAMALKPEKLPPWLGPQIEPPLLRRGYASLHAVLAGIEEEIDTAAALTALDIAVLRVMIVHAWRRLALKHPNLPRAAHSPGWRGHDCRSLVSRLLGRFPRPSLEDIRATHSAL